MLNLGESLKQMSMNWS
ncbi:hypothetical protein C351_06214 [Cryptococcus neoformans c8]|nr:hypothetical protein C351_06214 [Cryptococcus neoformans var. grubii c8]